MATYDPNSRFGRLPVSVAPSPATTGTSLTVDVHGSDPFVNVTPPYYVLLKPAVVDPHNLSSETALVTASATGTRTGTATIEVIQDGFAGQGAVTVETTQAGGGGTNETQTLTINASGGTYTLTLGGQTTAATAWNASDATIKANLEALSTIGTGNVSVTSGVVTFQGDLAAQPVALLTATTTSLTGSGSVTVSGGVVTFGGGLMAGVDIAELVADGTLLTLSSAGRNEKVLITLNADAGTFTLTFGANTTAGQAYNASAATIQTALRGLASIGAGNVNVTGNDGGPYTVEFVSGKANTNVGAITASAASLTLNTRVFSPITRAQKNSTARSVVVGDTIEVTTLPDYTYLTVNISGSLNDWNPSGVASAAIIRLNPSGASTVVYDITGMAFGTPGREITLLLDGAAGVSPSVVLRKNDPGSAAGNQIALYADLPLPYLTPVTLWYDGAQWRLRSSAPQDGPVTITVAKTLSVSTPPFIECDTGAGAFALTLPAAPVFGQRFVIDHYLGAPALTIGRNGKTIGGVAADITLAVRGLAELLYDEAGDWKIVSSTNGALPGTALWATQAVSGTTTLTDGSAPIVEYDTTAAAFTVTLPASPSTGSWFRFVNTGGSANQLTIGRNGKLIDGSATDIAFNLGGVVRELLYEGTQWRSAGIFRQAKILSVSDPLSATPNSIFNVAVNTFQYFAETTSTNTTVAAGVQGVRTTGTAAAGLGGRLSLDIEDDAGSDVEAVRIEWVWTDPTAGATVSELRFYTRNAGTLARRGMFSGPGELLIGTTTELVSGPGVTSKGPVQGGSVAMLAITTADQVLATNYAAVVPNPYEIGSTFATEIGSGGTLEILA